MRAFLFIRGFADYLQGSAIGRLWWLALGIGVVAWVIPALLQYLTT